MNQTSSSRTRAYLALAAVYFLLFLLLFHPWDGHGIDDVFYYSYLSSPLFDGDVDVLNDYYLSNNLLFSIGHVGRIIGPKGLVLNQFAAGSALLWLPFYLPVRAVAWAAGLFGAPPAWAADRFSSAYLLAISLATCCYGFLALLLTYALCATEFKPPSSACAALGASFASPLLAYDFQFGAMSHTPSAFCVALLLSTSLRHREFRSLDSYLLIGATLGLATLVRWQDAIFGLVPAALWLEQLARGARARPLRRDLLELLLGAIVCLAIVSLQAAFWWAQLGRVLTIPQGGSFLRWRAPQLWGVLFSGWHGLFYWHPLLLLGLGGLFVYAAPRPRRVPGAALLVCLALTTYVNASVSDWWGGAAGAGRRFSSAMPVFALGLAAGYSLLRGRLAAIPVALTAVALAVELLLLLALLRGVGSFVYLDDLWLLRADLVRFFPDWIRAVPLNGLAGIWFFLAHEHLKAALLALTGLLMLGTLLGFALRGSFALVERRARIAAPAFAAVILLLDLAVILISPPPDERGMQFGKLLAHGRSLPLEKRKALVEELIRSDYRNPSLYLYAVEVLGERERIAEFLPVIRGFSPHLWGRWIESLPSSEVSDALRAEALEQLRRPFPTPEKLYWESINAAGRRSKTMELAQVRRLLCFNPFHTPALRRAAEIAALKGRQAEAGAYRTRVRRFLEAKLHAFFAVESRVAPRQAEVFQADFLPYALDLGDFYERNLEPSRVLALYARIERFDSDDHPVRRSRLALQKRLSGSETRAPASASEAPPQPAR